MMTITKHILGILAVSLGLVSVQAHAAGEAYPSRSVRLVVPYTPGGAADQLARVLANRLSKSLGQQVIVDNRPGANTAIGAQHVATAPGDGHTLFLGSSASMVLNPLLYPKLTYNPDRDLTPVSVLTTMPLVMVVNPQVQARTPKEFVALAKANPGKMNFASVGIGNPLHLAAELFKMEAGIEMAHIPFNGSAPALASLMGGDVQVFFDGVSTAVPLVKAGKLRALAVTTTQRLKALPEVPTVAESGFPNYEASTWFGLAAPSKTSPEIVEALNKTVGSILVDPEFRQQFEQVGLLVHQPTSVQETKAFLKRDSAKWSAIIKANQITLE